MLAEFRNNTCPVLNRYLILVVVLCFFMAGSAKAQIDTDDYNKAIILIYQADTLIKNQAYTEAIDNLELAIELDSVIREQYILLTQACFYGKDLNTAQKYLEKAKLIFEEDDELCYYLGKVYEREMNLQLAINEFETAIKWSKKNGTDYPIVYDYYASRGSCYLQLGEYQKALDDLDSAFTFNDTKPIILMRRGVALYHLNKKDEACNSWAKALEMGMQQAEIYLNENCK